jgi:hypothetical protein
MEYGFFYNIDVIVVVLCTTNLMAMNIYYVPPIGTCIILNLYLSVLFASVEVLAATKSHPNITHSTDPCCF